MTPIAILFSLPADSARTVLSVMSGAPAGQELPVQALAEDRSTLLATGQLLTADNAIDTTTGSLRFKAVFGNPDQKLYANQFVNVRVRLKTDPAALAVPTQAIQQGAAGSFVYVVGQGDIPSLRNVTAGVVEDGFTAVSGDLKAGEQVITDGTDKVKPGEKVRIGKPAPQVAARVESGQGGDGSGHGHGGHSGHGRHGQGQGQGQGQEGQGQDGQNPGQNPGQAAPGTPGTPGPQGAPAPPGGQPPTGDAPTDRRPSRMPMPAIGTATGDGPAAASTGFNVSPNAADDAATDARDASGQSQPGQHAHHGPHGQHGQYGRTAGTPSGATRPPATPNP